MEKRVQALETKPKTNLLRSLALRGHAHVRHHANELPRLSVGRPLRGDSGRLIAMGRATVPQQEVASLAT